MSTKQVAFPDRSFPKTAWPQLTWPLGPLVLIPYLEVAAFTVELAKVVTLTVELAKVVALTAYAELEDNS